MAKFMNNPLLLIIFQLSLVIIGALSVEAHDDDRKVYIVYMGSISEEYSLTSEYHIGILQQVLQGSMAKDVLVRSYRKGFNGFAARLTEEEGENLKSVKGVVTVFTSRTLQLQTTRSWDFMGFPKSMSLNNKSAESNLIVGVIDSGIWPESHSFNDDGFDPPPKKWKGVCKGGANFTCNNKLIGARTFFESARDYIGHGTHTASTAAGRMADKTGFYGLAEGSARGAVPSARVAMYKVCAESGCPDETILAAFDEAIADGVDLITISIGGASASDMYSDSIAIGSFHAMQKGILTMQSAGNNGNDSASVASVAPWLCTVAAGTTDRRILDKLVLGNRKTLVGNSINTFSLKGNMFPLVYGTQASSNCSESDAKTCLFCLDEKKVKGKIIVCNNDDGNAIKEGFRNGALGVLARTSYDDVSEISPMPAIEFKTHEFEALLSYLNSTKAPKATILKSEPFNDTSAPAVVSFSSRGPNVMASDILKPDISAPGVEILAAFSPEASVSNFYKSDTRKVNYSILSGTSMACPHVAGAAAYLKSLHPDWSPSAIKSALMTTARPMSPSKNSDAEFAYGSGYLNPLEAANPGLVYETTPYEYLLFLCKLGYTDNQITAISNNKTFSCPKKSNNTSSAPKDLNYPTMSVLVDTGKSFNVKFSRTVTNVGVANSTYTAKVESAKGTTVSVQPNSLSFTSLNEKKNFDVTVVGKGLSTGSLESASLVWSDGVHTVRSPIVVYTKSDV